MDRTDVSRGTRAWVLAVTAVATTAVLLLTASEQIYDATHYSLNEAVSILAGDVPYRDFYDGSPLAGLLSAAMQALFGYRLLGEFVKQWIFIVAAMVLAVHMALRQSRSVGATLLLLPLLLILLVGTQIYHYSKLFFFPLALLLAWRYVERPGAGRAVALAVCAVMAFFYRHDYGIYLGTLSVLACAVALARAPLGARVERIGRDVVAYAFVVVLLLAPWAAVVHHYEGLPSFLGYRFNQYQSTGGWVFRDLVRINPFRTLRPEALPVTPGAVAFAWNGEVPAARRAALPDELGLRPVGEGAEAGTTRFAVADLNDRRLWRLRPLVHDADGLEWRQLRRAAMYLPPRANLELWLSQTGQLVAVGLLLAAAVSAWRARRRGAPVPLDGWRLALGGAMLVIVDSALLREPSYVTAMAPMTAALAAGGLTDSRVRRLVGGVVLVLTTLVALLWVYDTPLVEAPAETWRRVPETFGRLTMTPPEYDRPFIYLRDCTVEGDHILVTGTTPLHVNYYARRPMAGGQINWHRGWRATPEGDAEALALLRRQSVPIAYSTGEPVLVDFRPYPRVRAYLEANYVEVPGTNGTILVDRRRTPVGTYGPEGWPCFR